MTIEELQTALDKANASVTRLEGKNEDLIGKLKTANDRADTAEVEAKKVTDAETRATTAESALNNLKAESALNTALLVNNVDPKHIPLIVKATKGDITFADDGEPLLEGKSIEKWGKDYFAKEGSEYVRASDNSGGGATGNTSTVTTQNRLTKKPETPAEWDILDAMSAAERNAFAESIQAPDLKV